MNDYIVRVIFTSCKHSIQGCSVEGHSCSGKTTHCRQSQSSPGRHFPTTEKLMYDCEMMSFPRLAWLTVGSLGRCREDERSWLWWVRDDSDFWGPSLWEFEKWVMSVKFSLKFDGKIKISFKLGKRTNQNSFNFKALYCVEKTETRRNICTFGIGSGRGILRLKRDLCRTFIFFGYLV